MPIGIGSHISHTPALTDYTVKTFSVILESTSEFETDFNVPKEFGVNFESTSEYDSELTSKLEFGVTFESTSEYDSEITSKLGNYILTDSGSPGEDEGPLESLVIQNSCMSDDGKYVFRLIMDHNAPIEGINSLQLLVYDKNGLINTTTISDSYVLPGVSSLECSADGSVVVIGSETIYAGGSRIYKFVQTTATNWQAAGTIYPPAGNGWVAWPTISADGTVIAYAQAPDHTTTPTIYVLDFNTFNTTSSIQVSRSFRMSRDKQTILALDENDVYNVYDLDPSGTSWTLVSTFAGNPTGFDFFAYQLSEDGQTFVGNVTDTVLEVRERSGNVFNVSGTIDIDASEWLTMPPGSDPQLTAVRSLYLRGDFLSVIRYGSLVAAYDQHILSRSGGTFVNPVAIDTFNWAGKLHHSSDAVYVEASNLESYRFYTQVDGPSINVTFEATSEYDSAFASEFGYGVEFEAASEYEGAFVKDVSFETVYEAKSEYNSDLELRTSKLFAATYETTSEYEATITRDSTFGFVVDAQTEYLSDIVADDYFAVTFEAVSEYVADSFVRDIAGLSSTYESQSEYISSIEVHDATPNFAVTYEATSEYESELVNGVTFSTVYEATSEYESDIYSDTTFAATYEATSEFEADFTKAGTFSVAFEAQSEYVSAFDIDTTFAVTFESATEYDVELTVELGLIEICFCVNNNLVITQIVDTTFMITGAQECYNIGYHPQVTFIVPEEDGAEFEIPELQL